MTLQEKIYEKLKTDKRANTYVIPYRVMDCIVEAIEKDVLELVGEDFPFDTVRLMNEVEDIYERAKNEYRAELRLKLKEYLK